MELITISLETVLNTHMGRRGTWVDCFFSPFVVHELSSCIMQVISDASGCSRTELYDLRYMPQILETAGVSSSTMNQSLVLRDWGSHLDSEMKRRLDNKRIASTLSTASAPTPAMDDVAVADGGSHIPTIDLQGNNSSSSAARFNVSNRMKRGRTVDSLLSESLTTLSHEHDSSIPADLDDTVGVDDDHTQDSMNVNPDDIDIDGDEHNSFHLFFPATSQVGRDPDPHSSAPDVQEVRDADINVSLKNLRSKSRCEQIAMIRGLDREALHKLLLGLLDVDSRQTNQIERLQKIRKHTTQKVRRQKQRIERSKTKIHDLQNPALQELDVRRKNSRRLSWRGMISLGLRKSIALISASMFPNAALLDISRNTVIRSEVLTAAFLVARISVFHNLLYELLKQISDLRGEAHTFDDDDLFRYTSGSQLVSAGQYQPNRPNIENKVVSTDQMKHGEYKTGAQLQSQDSLMCDLFGLPSSLDPSELDRLVHDTSNGTFMVGCTAFSSDATNSSIFQRQKLQGIIITSALLKDWIALRDLKYGNVFASITALYLV